MLKKLISTIIAIGTISLSASVASVADDTNLLGNVPDNRLLGVSSLFSVFVEDDLTINGADCEGRIAAGGGANLNDSLPYYSTISNVPEASVIVGKGPLKNFDIGNRKFVVGTEVSNEDIYINTSNVYKADLIDFENEFNTLSSLSVKLSNIPNTGSVEVNPNWEAQINFTGDEPDYNIFELPEGLINTDNTFFNFDVPKDSYIIVNVPGGSVNMYTQLFGCAINGERIMSNSDINSTRILFNLYEATSFTIEGIGTLYGTILAPNADGVDGMTQGAHLAGGLIAKSYNGGIEFGKLNFYGDLIDDSVPEVTTTTTTTTTTTPKVTTTTTQPVTTTTSSTTTTTTVATTTTSLTTTTSTTTTVAPITTILTTTSTTTTTSSTTTTSTTTSTTSTTTTSTTTTTTTTTTLTTTTGTTTSTTVTSTTTSTTTIPQTTTITEVTTVTTTTKPSIMDNVVTELATTSTTPVSNITTTASTITNSPSTHDSINKVFAVMIISGLVIALTTCKYKRTKE